MEQVTYPPTLPVRVLREMAESVGIKKPTDDVLKHIDWKLSETAFFLAEMEAKSKATLGGTRFEDFNWTTEQIAQAQQFMFFFSAMLSAWKTGFYYLRDHCNRTELDGKTLVDANASQWFASLRGENMVGAFSLLRNSDIHDGALNAGVQYTVDIGFTTTSGSFCLNGVFLSYRQCFERHPWALDILAKRPILQVAHDALRDLRQAVKEATEAGHLAH